MRLFDGVKKRFISGLPPKVSQRLFSSVVPTTIENEAREALQKVYGPFRSKSGAPLVLGDAAFFNLALLVPARPQLQQPPTLAVFATTVSLSSGEGDQVFSRFIPRGVKLPFQIVIFDLDNLPTVLDQMQRKGCWDTQGVDMIVSGKYIAGNIRDQIEIVPLAKAALQKPYELSTEQTYEKLSDIAEDYAAAFGETPLPEAVVGEEKRDLAVKMLSGLDMVISTGALKVDAQERTRQRRVVSDLLQRVTQDDTTLWPRAGEFDHALTQVRAATQAKPPGPKL